MESASLSGKKLNCVSSGNAFSLPNVCVALLERKMDRKRSITIKNYFENASFAV